MAIANRSKALIVLAVLFLGGGSLWIWIEALTFDGGVQGYLSNYDGRRSPWLLLLSATILPIMIAWRLDRMSKWRKPPVYLEGQLLHAESWRQPLPMSLVERIEVDQAGCITVRPSATVFILNDGSERRLPITFYKESASGVAADIGGRFSLKVEDPTIAKAPS